MAIAVVNYQGNPLFIAKGEESCEILRRFSQLLMEEFRWDDAPMAAFSIDVEKQQTLQAGIHSLVERYREETPGEYACVPDVEGAGRHD